MRQGAKIKVPRGWEHREREFRVLYQPPGSFEVHVHNNCLCNEEISLRNRVLQETPPTDPLFARRLRRLAHRVSAWVGRHQPMDGEWIQQYSGRKRTMYNNAAEDLLVIPFSRRDRYIKSFIKPEKISDPTRDPRTIQARNPRYNLVLGNYLKPIEHLLYNIRGTRQLRKWLPRGRLIAKGRDLRSRAYLAKRKFGRFARPCCISLDASRFDAHVNQTLLSIEHAVYKGCYPGDRLLQQCLDLQLVNRGHTSLGIKYVCPGGRMSGDMNTALGNCLLMIMIVAVVMRDVGLRINQWDVMCDGDDTIIFMSRDHLEQFMANHTFHQSGLTMKLEAVSYNLHDIPFCQGKVVDTADGLKFVQDPVRSMSRSLVSTRHYAHPSGVNKVLGQIGLCELAINMGVPVLQEYALAMIRNAGGETPKRLTYTGRVFKAQREFKAHGGIVTPLPVTAEARETFEQAFGMTWLEQEALERHLREVVF